MKLSCEIDLKTVLRCLLGIIFLWAALSKIANPQEFYVNLAAYQLPLPVAALRSTAVILPWIELLCGLLLISGLHLNAALFWIGILALIFAIATAQAWARGLHIACGCLDLRIIGLDGKSSLGRFVESPGFAFLRALLLVTSAGYLFLDRLRPESRDRAAPSRA